MNLAKYFQRLSQNWLIQPLAHDSMLAALVQADAMSFTPGSFTQDAQKPAYQTTDGGVAVVSIHGQMAIRPDDFEQRYMGMVCMEATGNAINQAVADPKVRAIMLDFDSPGGTACGTPELAATVKSATAKKPVVSFSDSLQCSAAYYVGSQASAVLATGSAVIGNVGTVLSYMDWSGYLQKFGVKVDVIRNDSSPLKGAGFFGTSLTKDQRQFLQDGVNQSAEEFKTAVRSARSCPDEAMNGGWYSGNRALSLKLCDQLCTRDTALRTAAQLAR